MTVNELIQDLQKMENKDLPVTIIVESRGNTYGARPNFVEHFGDEIVIMFLEEQLSEIFKP